MICILALVVFGILGIFSVRYRNLAAKALDCVFRRVTLRPCQSGMDQQLKSNLVGLISRKNVNAARFVVKHFELLSWLFTLLMIASIFFSARGLYFYVVYGNCNGATSDEFCVFDALNRKEETSCEDPSLIGVKNFTAPDISNAPSVGAEEAKVTIIEFGCYSCPYTKEAQDTVNEILDRYGDMVKFVYMDFPLPTHNNSRLMAMAAECVLEQSEEEFWKYHLMLFDYQDPSISTDALVELTKYTSIDQKEFSACLGSDEVKWKIDAEFQQGKDSGIYGTPTFFINEEVVIGPKPFRYFKNIIDKELSES